MKTILVILDGMGDLPVRQFEGRTPLEAANMPNLDFLATRGEMGYMFAVRPGFIPDSNESLMSIFGNQILSNSRGQLEVNGTEIETLRGDLVFAVNFGSIDINGKIVDRRAGRNLTYSEANTLTNSLNKIKLACKFEIQSIGQHRAVIVFRGGFSDNITGNDSSYLHGKVNEKNTLGLCRAMDEEENSIHSANIVNDFLEQAQEILKKHGVNQNRIKKGLFPANCIFLRSPGIESPKLKKYKKWLAICYRPMEKGFARLSEMSLFSFDYPKLKNFDAYDNLHKGLIKACNFSVEVLKKNYKNYDFAYIHLNEIDFAGHDNKPIEKKAMLEEIDKTLFSFLKKFVTKNKINVIVTANHSTPCKLKNHSSDSVPVLFYNDSLPKIKKKELSIDEKKIANDFIEIIKQKSLIIKHGFIRSKISEGIKFCEKTAMKGSLGRIIGSDLFKKVGIVR